MAILTQARLASLASTSLLSHNWYYIAAAAFSVCNQPDEIPLIFEYVMKHTQEDHQFAAVQKIREALLKGSALGGLPKTINSMMKLKTVTPPNLRETHPLRESTVTTEEDVEKGATFFDQVYGKISGRVMSQMSTAYPDLGNYAISHVYAPLLSYTGVLSPKETSLVVIACLVPQDVNPQLKGHLKGALNNGATREEVMSVRSMAIKICEWSGITWKNEVAKL